MKRSDKGNGREVIDDLDFLIRDTRLLMMHHVQSRVEQLGIPLRAWFPLRVLLKNEGITQRELGRMLHFGDAHAGVIVRMMQRQKLVIRRQSRTDRRRIDLYLTPAGRKTARRTLRLMQAIQARITTGLTASEARSLKALLLRAHENLKSP